MATTLVVLLGVSLASMIRFDNARRNGRRSSEARRATTEVLDAVIDAETAQRGYMLTGKESYLDPFVAGQKRLPQALDKLRALTTDTPEQQQRFAELARTADQTMSAIDDAITQLRAGRRDAAMAIFASDRGKTLMDRTRELATQIGDDSEARLERQRDSVANGFLVALIFDGLATVLVLVLGAALFGIDRDIRRRSELEHDLRLIVESERNLQ